MMFMTFSLAFSGYGSVIVRENVKIMGLGLGLGELKLY